MNTAGKKNKNTSVRFTKEVKSNSRFFLPALLVIVAGIYFPAIFNGFVNWDDPVYVTHNPLIQNLSIENLKLIFFQSFDGHFHPLTLLSLSFDRFVSDSAPWFFHLINVILHLLNTFFVYKLACKLLKNNLAAFITALLFGIHPLNVEAVAWITARKDVLYSFFFLLAIFQYIKYIEIKNFRFLIYALLLFVCSALSKEQAVALAPALILFDILYKRRIFSLKVVLEKIPFFLIAILMGIAVIWAQKETGYLKPLSGETVSLVNRLILGSYGVLMYVYKIIIPLKLAVFYPYPFDSLKSAPIVYWLSTAIIPLVIWILFFSYKRSRLVFFGFAFFLINIFLLLRYLQANPGDFYFAERYCYIPAVGIFLLAGNSFRQLFLNKKIKKLVIVFAVLILAGFSSLTVMRILTWKDSLTLLNDQLKKYPEVYTALNCRGDVLFEKGDYQSALKDFNAAIKLNGSNDRAFANRGKTRALLEDISGAKDDLDKAVMLDPKNPSNYINRGIIKDISGDPKNAIEDFNFALQLDVNAVDAYVNRGSAWIHLGDFKAAIDDYNKALIMIPLLPAAYAGRGTARSNNNEFETALADFNQAVSLGYSNPDLWYQRGLNFYKMKNFISACADFSEVVKLQKNNAWAWAYKGFANYNLEKYSEAISDLNKATELMPGFDMAYAMRGMCYLRLGRTAEGCADLRVAVNFGNKAAAVELEKNCNTK